MEVIILKKNVHLANRNQTRELIVSYMFAYLAVFGYNANKGLAQPRVLEHESVTKYLDHVWMINFSQVTILDQSLASQLLVDVIGLRSIK